MPVDMKSEGVIENMRFRLFKNNTYIEEPLVDAIRQHLILNRASLASVVSALVVLQIMIMLELTSTWATGTQRRIKKFSTCCISIKTK